MIDEVIDKILEERITVVASDVLNGKIEFVYRVIEKLGVFNNNSIHVFNYDGSNSWVTKNLIATISGIDKKKVSAYYEPCGNVGKIHGGNIDTKKYIEAIEKLQASKVWMTDFSYQIIDSDYLDYFLNYHKEMEENVSNLYVINTFDALLRKTKYQKGEVLSKIISFAKENDTHVLLVVKKKHNIPNELKLTDVIDYNILKNYVRLFVLLGLDDNKLNVLIKDKGKIVNCCWLLNKNNNRIVEGSYESKNIKRN